MDLFGRFGLIVFPEAAVGATAGLLKQRPL